MTYRDAAGRDLPARHLAAWARHADTLDPETRIEYLMWIGREVWMREGESGIVTDIRRKDAHPEGLFLSDEVAAESERRRIAEGKCWWSQITFLNELGQERSVVRCASWLRAVHADLDTRAARFRL